MEFITKFSESWNDPQLRHALLVHWPVVLSVASAVLVLLVLLTAARNNTVRLLALGTSVAAMYAAYLALQSGGHAENAAGFMTDEARAVLEHHEELGEKAPLFGVICAGLVMLTFLPWKRIRLGAAAIAFIACTVNAAWVLNTAHHGGQLVYAHGVGTPAPAQQDDLKSTTPATSTAPAGDARAALFDSTIKPILSSHCVECHNPTRSRRSGGLDQTTRETMMRGGRSGPVIVEGMPEQSLLIQRVRSADDPMPPDPKPRLTEEQIRALEQWIRDGAAWDASFLVPTPEPS